MKKAPRQKPWGTHQIELVPRKRPTTGTFGWGRFPAIPRTMAGWLRSRRPDWKRGTYSTMKVVRSTSSLCKRSGKIPNSKRALGVLPERRSTSHSNRCARAHLGRIDADYCFHQGRAEISRLGFGHTSAGCGYFMCICTYRFK
jgi:hypothetical protein